MTADEATRLADEHDAATCAEPSQEKVNYIREKAMQGHRGVATPIFTHAELAWLRLRGFKITFGAPTVIEWP